MCALLGALLLAGCGSSHHLSAPTPAPLALVGGQPISQADFQQYLTYTIHFYAWSHGDNMLDACRKGSQDFPCATLARQVLARLIQERIVLNYARQHRIALDAPDEREVSKTLQEMAGKTATTAALFTQHGIAPSFMRDVLRRELLIQKVEQAIAPPSTQRGFTYHVARYTIRYNPTHPDSSLYHQAVTLATYGHPIPERALTTEQWIAPAHLTAEERKLFAAAQPGDFVGPFKWHAAYVVFEVLGRGIHRYGKPARQALETKYFLHWLHSRMGVVRCLHSGKRIACPPIDERSMNAT